MGYLYVLNAAGEPEAITDPVEWGRWFEASTRDRSRILAHDKDEGAGASGVLVSTVFLGLDHNYSAGGPPVLWETLVMGGPLDGEMRRYTSRDAAFQGHQAMCAKVRAAGG